MQVGDKVVCVDDKLQRGVSKFHNETFKTWIKEGEIYTLRAVAGGGVAGTGVLLKEIKNPKVYCEGVLGKMEPRFAIQRFRPLDEVLKSLSVSVENIVEEVVDA